MKPKRTGTLSRRYRSKSSIISLRDFFVPLRCRCTSSRNTTPFFWFYWSIAGKHVPNRNTRLSVTSFGLRPIVDDLTANTCLNINFPLRLLFPMNVTRKFIDSKIDRTDTESVGSRSTQPIISSNSVATVYWMPDMDSRPWTAEIRRATAKSRLSALQLFLSLPQHDCTILVASICRWARHPFMLASERFKDAAKRRAHSRAWWCKFCSEEHGCCSVAADNMKDEEPQFFGDRAPKSAELALFAQRLTP